MAFRAALAALLLTTISHQQHGYFYHRRHCILRSNIWHACTATCLVRLLVPHDAGLTTRLLPLALHPSLLHEPLWRYQTVQKLLVPGIIGQNEERRPWVARRNAKWCRSRKVGVYYYLVASQPYANRVRRWRSYQSIPRKHPQDYTNNRCRFA